MKSSFLYLALLVSFVSGCTRDQPTPIPTVDSVNPQFAAVGNTVVISGTGFSSTPSDNKVTFNEIPASVTSANSTELTVVVPTGAFSDELRAAAVFVAKNGQRSSTPQYLKGDRFPEITAIQPSSGPVGTVITITGRNFNPTIDGSAVLFWGTTSGTGNPRRVPISATSTTIQVQVPVGTTTGDACLMTFVTPDKSKYLSDCKVFTITP